jgi:putative endonuclease
MAQHNELGKKGENIAFEFLIRKGYQILARNWHYKKAEIDLVATKDDLLIVIEVKTRSAAIYEEPSDAITDGKIRNIVNAAEAYLIENEIDYETRFDVIFIKWFGDGKYDLNHIEDAFIPPVN